MEIYNYNSFGLINGGVTALHHTNSKLLEGYSHDIHSLIGAWKFAGGSRNLSSIGTIQESKKQGISNSSDSRHTPVGSVPSQRDID